MDSGIQARLAEILVQEDPWAEALTCIAHGTSADIGVAFEAGSPPVRLGIHGPLPPAAQNASDEATLVHTFERAGMAVWTHVFSRDKASPLVIGLATRRQ